MPTETPPTETILDARETEALVSELATAIDEAVSPAAELVLVGIRRRGVGVRVANVHQQNHAA